MAVGFHIRVKIRIECQPQAPRVAEEPNGEKHAESGQNPERCSRREDLRKIEREVRDDDQQRGEAVIEIDRPQKVSRRAAELHPASVARLVHGEPTTKQRPLAALRAAKTDGSEDQGS